MSDTREPWVELAHDDDTADSPIDHSAIAETYPLHIRVTQDEDGGYSAVVMNLPGAGSCGLSEHEAIDNATEAARAVIEQYKEDGLDIPWKDTSRVEPVAGAIDKRIVLNV